MAEFDVIIVGGGVSGGLPAAAYLQKAGAKCVVIEKRHDLGCFDPGYEIWPETNVYPHANIYLGGMSPYWEDLELEKYGLRNLNSPVIYGVLGADGKCLWHYLDPKKTYESCKKFSEKDAKKLQFFWETAIKVGKEFQKLICYQPPNPEYVDKLFELTAAPFGLDGDTIRTMNGIQLLEETFESEYARASLSHLAIGNYFGDFASEGIGATSVAANNIAWSSSILRGGNHQLVHALQRLFLSYGGIVLRSSPVEKVIIKNGKAVGVRLSKDAACPEKEIYAKKAVILDLQAPASLELIGEDAVKQASPELWAKMKFWKSSMKSSCLALITIKGSIPWKANEVEPVSKVAHLRYMFSSWDDIKEYYYRIKSHDSRAVFDGWYHEMVNNVIDPTTISPEGYMTIRCDLHVPAMVQGNGMEWWDENRRRIIKECFIDKLEVMAPGLKDKIYEIHLETPYDIWRENPIGMPTHIVGGDFTDDQWYLGRMPYKMPIEGLYCCNSVWPCPASWGATGYIVASVVATDLGIRKQPWWVHEPTDYFFKNIQRDTYQL
jgi:phytoene dehydrogenase-like protein